MSDFPTQKVSRGAKKPAAMRPGSRSHEVRREAKKVMSALPGVEMLKFSARESNVITVLEQYSKYAVKEHGIIGKFVRSNAYPAFPPMPPNNAPVFAGLTNDQRDRAKDKMLEDRVKTFRRWEDAKPRMFSEILMLIPAEAMHVLEERAEWQATVDSQDPLTLLRLIKPFFVSPGMTDNIAKRKTLVERSYHSCYQRHGENDKAFYERLKLAADAMKELGPTYAISDEDQARHYLMRLQPHHAEMVASLLNDADTKPLPDTMAEAYTKTVSWVKAAKRPVMDDRRVPTAYLAEQDDGEDNDSYLDDYGGENYIWEDNDDGTERAYMTKHKQGTKGFKGNCFVCGEQGHMGRDCKQRKGAQPTKDKTEERAMTASLKDEGEDEYGIDEYGFMAREVPEEIETTVSAAAMAAIGNPTDRTLILDSACTTHVVGNRELLTDVREANTRCRVKGIGGDMVTRLVGELKHFGTAYLVDGLGVNLISFAEVEDKHIVTYQRGKYMRVHVNKEADITFNRVGKLYKTTVPRRVNEAEEAAMVTTVASLEGKYSAREVEGARKARQVLRTLGIPSFADVISMMLKGKILNMPVSVQDLMRAREIYGRDEAEIKGKTVNKGTVKFEEISVPRMMEKNQKLYSDIFNIRGVPGGNAAGPNSRHAPKLQENECVCEDSHAKTCRHISGQGVYREGDTSGYGRWTRRTERENLRSPC